LTQAPETTFTVQQAASVLCLHPRTVRDLIQAGCLPAFNVGQGSLRPVYRVTDVDLAAFIEERRVKP
jgi:excisionase family DNA binding protein